MSEPRTPQNQSGQSLVPCELCGMVTPMLGTRRCDSCWELERRIRRDPDLARRILQAVDFQALVDASNA